MTNPFPWGPLLAGGPAGRYNGTREGSRKRGPSYKVRDPHAAKPGVARLSFCIRFHECVLPICGMPEKHNKAHPQRGVRLSYAKAPIRVAFAKANES